MKTKKITSILLVLMVIFSLFTASACTQSPTSSSSSSSSSSSGKEETVEVIFDLNYEGGGTIVKELKKGATVAEPDEEIVREGYTFAYWATDAEGVTPYTFGEAANENLTLYAIWISGDVQTVKLTFDYNYESAQTSFVIIEKGKRASKPTSPVRDGYYFYGWYTDKEGQTAFSFLTKLEENVTVYAKWGELVTFEAEDLDFSDMSGPGWSGGASGKDMIVYAYADRYGVKPAASNGFYVSFLFAKFDAERYNTTLVFHINSDKAVKNAVMYLRLAAEAEMTITPEDYIVEVNGINYSYESIALKKTDAFNADLNSLVCDFDDYLITAALNLNEGENVIKLKVNNTKVPGGTLLATAPDVDCLKIASADSKVSWASGYPKAGNYDINDY